MSRNIIIGFLFTLTVLSCLGKQETKVSNKLYPIKVNNKFGYIDVNGKKVIEPQYDNADEFIDSFAIVKINQKEGAINLRGEFVINPTFISVSKREDDYFVLQIGENLCNITKAGKKDILVQTDNMSIRYFRNGYFIIYVIENGFRFCYLINERGEKVSKDYKTLIKNGSYLKFVKGKTDMKNPLSLDAKKDVYGLIDIEDKVVLEDKYEDLGELHEGLRFFSQNGSFGYIDSLFRVKIPNTFYQAGDFNEGLAKSVLKISQNERKYGFIDNLGKTAIAFSFENVENFENGIARVGIGKNLGIAGRMVEMTSLKEIDDYTYGFINKEGKFLIPPVYKGIISKDAQWEINPENINGVIVVQKDRKFGAFDTLGIQIIPFEFDFITQFDKYGFAKFEMNTEKGFINSKGKKIFSTTNVEKMYLSDFDENGIAKIQLDGRERYITTNGKFIW